VFGSNNEGMSEYVTQYEEGCRDQSRRATLGAEVTELLLPLLSTQFLALEDAATRLNLTVGQLIRRTVGEFLMQCNPAESPDCRR
jgi:hypothetical protein